MWESLRFASHSPFIVTSRRESHDVISFLPRSTTDLSRKNVTLQIAPSLQWHDPFLVASPPTCTTCVKPPIVDVTSFNCNVY